MAFTMMLRTAARQVASVVRGALVRTGGDRVLAEFTPGVSKGSLRARLAPDHLFYKSPTIRTIVRNGIRFELDLSDYMQWCVYYGIEVEPRTKLYSLVRAGDVVFDVGANVGEVLLNSARLTGERGQIFGFEINPRTYQRCLHNIGLNSFPNVRLFGVGLGSRKGSLTLGSPNARNSGQDRVVRGGGAGDSSQGIAVEVTTMDAFVAEQRIERLDLVKIDVEGFEMDVLRGAQRTLETFRPRLFIELDDSNLRQQQSSAKEMVEFLERLGYRLTHAEENRAVTSTDSFVGQHSDIIGTPVPRPAQVTGRA
jgi:FkbM family methyltransferase